VAKLYQALKKLESGLVVSARTRARQQRIRQYIQSDRRPWSTGYLDYKMQVLRSVLTDPDLMRRFRDCEALPTGFAPRLDARLIEIPWLLSRLGEAPATMLDAGSALNHRLVLETPPIPGKRLTILTLAPEKECHWNASKRGVSYVFEDMRELPFRDALFDVIACISTIEHVGMDNTMYARDVAAGQQGAPSDFLVALAELRRVLKPGGTLYLSVPFGRYENHGWFQQFDAALLDRLIHAFMPASVSETVYRYRAEGWTLSNREDCADCEYFNVHTSKYFDPTSTIDFPSDYPAGERAVACLELHKPRA